MNKIVILFLSLLISCASSSAKSRSYVQYKFRDKKIQKELALFFDRNIETKKKDYVLMIKYNIYNPGEYFFVKYQIDNCNLSTDKYVYIELKDYKCFLQKECLIKISSHLKRKRRNKRLKCKESDTIAVYNDGEAWEILFDFENRKIIEGEKYW